MILRIVEGAYKNTCDAHGIDFDPYFARSVAKRAAGTLSSEMTAVLAAKPSEKIGAATHLVNVARSARQAEVAKPVRTPTCRGVQNGAAVTAFKAAALRPLETWMFRQMRGLKDSGQIEKANAFIEILKRIAKLKEN